MRVCTIIAKNYLAFARVLGESLRANAPSVAFTVLCVDDLDGYVDPGSEPFELLGLRDIGLPDRERMVVLYDILELSTAVKPWLLRTLLARGGPVAYLDPDIEVVDPLDELEALVLEHGLVLTPHNVGPMPRDGKKPSEQDILVAGSFNLGFIALAPGEQSDALLDWWSERLESDCRNDPEKGFFVDQRWVDLVPGIVPRLHILRDPGYNVAYWNLAGRPLTRDDDGTVRAAGARLRFFHYSGYDPERPAELSKFQNRISLADDPVLADLCAAYGARLLAAGHSESRAWPYGYARLAGGLVLGRTMRDLYRTWTDDEPAESRGMSLFAPEGEERFCAWMTRTVEGAGTVNRFLLEVWGMRSDLRAAYPDPTGDDAGGLVGWAHVFGRTEVPIPDLLLPPKPAWLEREEREPSRPIEPLGVNLAAYLRSELGIGEVGRQVVGALDAAGVPVLPVALEAPLSRSGHTFDASTSLREPPFALNLVCVNADGLPAFAELAGEDFFAGRYTIGLWWWEVESFPEEFLEAFDHVDEVWVGSRFVADAIAAVSPVPVFTFPTPVELPPHRLELARERVPGGGDGPFTFLFSFDYNSVFDRKNPDGLVEAFRRAFPEPDPARVRLRLKSINEANDPTGRDRLRLAIRDRPDVELVEGYLDAADKDALIASCDCYVSLHRSEGLGLTMAEAILLGRPVIATGYGGNVDFMPEGLADLVPWTRVPIGPGRRPYPPAGTWAEPDLDVAAERMRAVLADPAAAAARSARLAERLRDERSAPAVGRLLRGRLLTALRTLGAREDGASARPSLQLDDLGETLGRGPAAPGDGGSLGPVGEQARRAALRVMRPYTAFQDQVNEQVQAAIEALEQGLRARTREVEATAAVRHAEALARLRAATARAEAVEHRLARLEALTDRLDAVEEVAGQVRAVPFMAEWPFEDWRVDGHAVRGYRAAAGDPGAAGDDPGGAGLYRGFEDAFRGDEAMIRERQRVYVPLLDGPVLDVGCGRGELLGLLAAAGVSARGVDLDAGMVERARAQGLDVDEGDAIAAVEAVELGSLGAVVALQVVEHLPYPELLRLLAGAHRALRPGGRLVLETVNPHAPQALKTFWVDPTHQHPLFPEVVLELCRLHGFASAFAFHPVPLAGGEDHDMERVRAGEYTVVAER